MQNTAPLILGTAGHIDHGKSTLIKALTGVDPDRLAEEKERGITIELGFAELVTPKGVHFGVVDVPGHEKFVRHMVSGAAGIDVALLVIAADDGIMVQTREHAAILNLLGVEHAVVALTKIDRVEADWADLVEMDIETLLEGTLLEGSPVVRVSSTTGRGIEALLSALDDTAEKIAERGRTNNTSVARLPIDRVFTISGAGTVVTGTLWSGAIVLGDELEEVSAHKKVRVRGIQVHNVDVEQALAGMRVALNLSNIDKSEVSRGDMLATRGALRETNIFNAIFTYIGSESSESDTKPLKSGTRVHVHHGTVATVGQIFFFDEKSIRPNRSVFAQIRLEKPIAPVYLDHFIIRSFSPVFTIGGGVVLDASPAKRTRISADEHDLLEALASRDYEKAACELLVVKKEPLSSAMIAGLLGCERSRVATALNTSNAARIKVAKETLFVDPLVYDHVAAAIKTELLALYDRYPSEHAFSLPMLKDRVDTRMTPEVFAAFAEIAAEAPEIELVAGRISHSGAASNIHALEDEIARQALARIGHRGLEVETTAELARALGADSKFVGRILGRIASEGGLIRLAGDLHFLPGDVSKAEEIVKKALRDATAEAPVSASELCAAMGLSRKYAIPLLEYFDSQGVTRRIGNGRILV
ncbi:MAG: selenocysteine-specific translation elongation factor [Coriobacteriia bacterium]|nr:selenocysteine-specific translation elongation factor [Coriobacteriia bacterium]